MAAIRKYWRVMVAVVVLVLIGPLMFFGSRGLSLDKAFDRINLGDPGEKVRATMGPPEAEAHSGLYLQGDTEYWYSNPPLPQRWVVSLKDDKVVQKARLQGTRPAGSH